MLIQQLVNGLTLGAIYSLIALGYTLVYGILTMINFAHSEVLMLGAFMALGLAAFSSGDRYMYTRAQLEAKIDIALGGLVAEELVFGSAEAIPGQWSTGPSNDLEKATQIAKMMVQTLGMGRKTGLAVTAPGERDYGRSPFGENVSALVFAEVNAILDESKKRVTERLTRNRHVLEALTAAVLSKETLIGDEIQETIDRAGPVMK